MSDFPDSPEAESYDAEQIKAFKAIESVRLRPAMYVGDSEKPGLHHILFECVDNSLHEAIAGYCSEIQCRIFKDGSVFVEDDGRGMLVEPKPGEKNRTWLESILTKIHIGRSINRESPYQPVLQSLCGVGIFATNALSEWLHAEVHHKGRIWTISYAQGKLDRPLVQLSKTSQSGTKFHFKPDPDIFGETTFDFELIRNRFEELAFLFPGVEMHLHDDRVGAEASFHSPDGINDYVRQLNQDADALFPEVFSHEVEFEGARIAVSFQPTTSFLPRVRSFVNAGACHEGTHIKGFRAGLKQSLHQYAVAHGMILQAAPTINHYYEGITAVISVWLEDPLYEGPTRFKLGNLEMAQSVAQVVREGVKVWAKERPEYIQQMIEKAVQSAELDMSESSRPNEFKWSS